MFNLNPKFIKYCKINKGIIALVNRTNNLSKELELLLKRQLKRTTDKKIISHLLL
tara:strand:- start:509 stop:673 length:165 start_codon:yes stop_codon:yes gene_type:complete